PMLEKEVVEQRQWTTSEELLDYYAVGQATPGIIAVNTATFVGYKVRGIIGAFFATLGVVFPSLVIILIIASFLQNFAQYEIVGHAFSGVRVAVAVLVLNAIIKLLKNSVVDKVGVVIFSGTFILGALLNISPIYIVVGASVLGLILKFRREEE
uniref:chromate transporter n=1 Tax=Faecalimicrobium dakarense TaxID=1301100 RepID=UPI0005A6C4C0